ncbi:glycine reductase, partial [Vibrio parahaemolyticus]|nr:glycine reductase [Vibrio parahaemolyticus]
MQTENVKKTVAKIFNEIADTLETGQYGPKIRVGVTTLGSEHGISNVVKGAELAQDRNKTIEVVLIGPKVESSLTQIIVDNEDEAYKKMEEMLDNNEINSCVTM